MRFRLPEIFLGCFLTVAVFAMGFLFASSKHPETPPQAHTTQTAESKSQKDLTDERLADYTFLLAWFTGVLAVSTVGLWIVTWRAGRSQSRDMQESLRLTAIAASATDRSARAAIALQLPIIRIKPDNLGHGDTQLAAGQKFEECFVPGV